HHLLQSPLRHVADAGHRLCSLKPSSQTNDSFSDIKLQWPAVQVVLISALPSRAHCSGSCSRGIACISVDNNISLCFIFSQSFRNTLSYQIVDGFLCYGFSYSGSPGRVKIGPGGSCSLWCHFLKITREQYT
nr:hypothetical protein [Tanacetum cinerariifolium]